MTKIIERAVGGVLGSGEVKVILINLGGEPFVVARGERIAQLVVAPFTRSRLEPRIAVGETARGTGGFGSTGTG